MNWKYLGIYTMMICFFTSPVIAQKKKAGKSIVKPQVKTSVQASSTYELVPFSQINDIKKPLNGTSILIKYPIALHKLDDLLENAINTGAFPGCQVVALKDGEVIVSKSYGTFNKDKKQIVTDTTMFDIASVTKIVATTLAVMKLYEEGKIVIKAKVSDYLPDLEGTDKGSMTIEQLLLHQGGFKSWIPFHKNAIDTLTGTLNSNYFKSLKSDTFSVPIAANLYMKPVFKFDIWKQIIASDLDNKGKYVYSDLDMLMLEKIVAKVAKKRFDYFVYDNFYAPLKLRYTFYNPWILGLDKQCAPTENDQYFRFQHLQGYVHDPVAALMGGVAGHAGIFSTANEIAIIMQMLNNGGVYNNKRYFKKETVQLFTSYRSSISRRGYGFDKPEKKIGEGGPTADICSKSTFGHTGFTGTCTWADPATGIVFVFLSNRVNPSQDNTLIQTMKIRGKAQQLIYEALGYGK